MIYHLCFKTRRRTRAKRSTSGRTGNAKCDKLLVVLSSWRGRTAFLDPEFPTCNDDNHGVEPDASFAQDISVLSRWLLESFPEIAGCLKQYATMSSDTTAPDHSSKILLSEQETSILDRQTANPPLMKLNYFSLFRYATRSDYVVMSVAGICAIAGGATLPVMNLVVASIAGNFSKYYKGQTSDFASEMRRLTLYLVYLAVAQLFTISITVLGFTMTGERITRRIRREYLASLLRQNMAYFDKIGAGEITTRITSDMNMVQDGISEKLGMTIKGISVFVAAYVVGFVVSWQLTLILTATVVVISGTLGGLSRFVIRWSGKSLACYAKGGGLAEEVLSPPSARNVLAFGIQDRLALQYDQHLKTAERFGFKMRSVVALMAGFLMFCIYSTYALAFWIGSRYLVQGKSSLTDILTVLLSIMGKS